MKYQQNNLLLFFVAIFRRISDDEHDWKLRFRGRFFMELKIHIEGALEINRKDVKLIKIYKNSYFSRILIKLELIRKAKTLNLGN